MHDHPADHPADSRSAPDRTAPHGRCRERGVALIVALFFTILVIGITVTGALVLRSHQAQNRTTFVLRGQSMQFARSGLTEALGWLRKQTAQPVLAIEPQLNPFAVPPVLDTSDPDIGIVREFQITETIWGRYEVWKQWEGDPDPTRLAWRRQMQCEDVSSWRGNLTPGSVWRMRSRGYVFRRADPGVAFNVPPNQVIGQEMAVVEARRLALQPPGQAALCTRNASGVQILTRGRVHGGPTAAGLYRLNGTGTVTVAGTGAALTGTPSNSAAPAYDDSFLAVFGVSLDELRAMADYNVTAAVDFPSPVPIDSVIVCSTGITFTASKPLRGTGIVVVVGDTTIGQGSYSNFSGLLYVQGNLVMRDPSEIQGAVVVTGTVRIEGSSDYVTITYDDGVLLRLRQEIGTYRQSSVVSRPLALDR